MRKTLYEAFTLVEMLIVMGILIILMAVGITAGRFAINRANDVAHQNAVDQIYTALQAYYTDNREFPSASACGTDGVTACSDLGTLVSEGELSKYLDEGTFNGGTEATFVYLVDQGQSALVCVTLGGTGDAKSRGVYCNGNGFNDSTGLGVEVTNKEVKTTDTVYTTLGTLSNADLSGDWNGSAWDSTGTTWVTSAEEGAV